MTANPSASLDRHEGSDLAEPRAIMTVAEFDALAEYSTSLPTAPSPGRRWKRAHPPHAPTAWYLGEAHALPDDDPRAKAAVGIRWTLILLRVG